jgi:hypothetical protein
MVVRRRFGSRNPAAPGKGKPAGFSAYHGFTPAVWWR